MLRGILGLMLSLPAVVVRVIITALLCFYFLEGIEMIDISKFGAIPEDWLVYIVVFGFIAGFVVMNTLRRVLHNRAADNKFKSGKIASKGDLEYNVKYDVGSAFGFIFGTAIGLFLTPVFISSFITGAGMWTYCAIGAILAAIFTAGITYASHVGIRVFIIQASEYVKGTVEDIKQAKENIEGAKKSAAGTITITKK